MSDIRTGWIQRHHLETSITCAIENAAKQPVNQASENQAYEIGKSLGYTDGLKAALQMVKDLPDEPRPKQRTILGRPETFG